MSDVYKAPESNLVNETANEGEYGSVEKAIRGEYEFTISGVLSEAWALTSGAKWPVFLAFVFYMLVMIGVMIVMAFGVMAVNGASPGSAAAVFVQIIMQLGMNLIAMPLAVGILILGIKRAVGAPMSPGSIFNYYSKTLSLFLTLVLVYIMVMIGLLLLVIPGIYLMIAYYMAMPLVVEKGMSPWQAMETSRKAITHRWFSFFGLGIVMMLIVSISVIPLGIGLVWTLPMMIIAFGVLYRNMFGVESSTIA